MSLTTDEQLAQEREESVRMAVESAIPKIIGQVSEVMEKTFATGSDVRGMVSDVIKAVTDDAAARISTVQKEQAEWRTEQTLKMDKAIAEQNAKMDVFFGEMRTRMDTFVTSERVDNLHNAQDDYRKHSESVLGGHGEAIDELKDRFKTMEALSHKSITGIRGDTERISKSVAVMTNTVAELARRDKKRTEEVDRQLASLRSTDDEITKDLNKLYDDMRRQDAAIDEQRVRWIEFSTPLNLLLNGDKGAKIPSLNERMVSIEKGLNSALWFINSWIGRGITGTILTALIASNLIGR